MGWKSNARCSRLSLLIRRWWRLGLLACCGLLCVLGVTWWFQRPSPLLDPLPQDPSIQVYFNQSQSHRYTEPYREQERLGDNLEQVVINGIRSAQSSVDVAVQELRLPGIAMALREQHQAGVRVRVILEHDYTRPWSHFTAAEVAAMDGRDRNKYLDFVRFADRNHDDHLSPKEIDRADGLHILQQSTIPWIDDTADGSKGSGLMHHKFVVIDGRIVIAGSVNFTLSGTHGDFAVPDSLGNANSLVKIESAPLAKLFTQEFNWMWGDGPDGKPDSLFGLQKPYRPPQQIILPGTTLEVQFSPTSPSRPWSESVNGLIGKTLANASQSIDLALFVFSGQNLSNVLETQHQRGIQIRVLIDPGFAYRSYSEAFDLMGTALAANGCRYEDGNRPWQTPIATVGVPNLASGDLLHHKFGAIDNTIVVVGSQNWSEAANHRNDETLLIIHNPTVAAHYGREFERLYAQATLGIPPKVVTKIEQQICSQPWAEGEMEPIFQESDSGEGDSATSSAADATDMGQRDAEVVNLNTATEAELTSLPGIGPALAERIVAAREIAPFNSLDDLDAVKGIGPSKLEQLRDRVTW